MESRRETFNYNKCEYSTKRSYNLKRHILNEHTADRNSSGPPKRPRIQETCDGLYTEKDYEKTINPSRMINHLGDGLPRRQQKPEPEDGLYTKEEYEENMASLRARFPTMNFDTIDPRFMHPFTAIIAGPSNRESHCSLCV